jgi:hypothetical protein
MSKKLISAFCIRRAILPTGRSMVELGVRQTAEEIFWPLLRISSE